MNPSTQNQARWYCVRTQTKREHIAAKHLKELDSVQVFCPRIRYRKATRRGKIWWIEPLFPGYVLVKFDLLSDERMIMHCQGVRGLVRFGSEIPYVSETVVSELIEQVRKQSIDTEELITVVTQPAIGDEVEIAYGPLQGMKGVIAQVSPATERIKVLLEFLGQTQAVDLDLFSILYPKNHLNLL